MIAAVQPNGHAKHASVLRRMFAFGDLATHPRLRRWDVLLDVDKYTIMGKAMANGTWSTAKPDPDVSLSPKVTEISDTEDDAEG